MIERTDLQRAERQVRVLESKLEKVEADLMFARARFSRIEMALEAAREQLGLGAWPDGLDLDARIDWLADEVGDVDE